MGIPPPLMGVCVCVCVCGVGVGLKMGLSLSKTSKLHLRNYYPVIQ